MAYVLLAPWFVYFNIGGMTIFIAQALWQRDGCRQIHALRKLVVNAFLTEQYDELLLGQAAALEKVSKEDYLQFPAVGWGGEPEVMIMAAELECEITIYDKQLRKLFTPQGVISHYAAVKKVRRAGLELYARMNEDTELTEDVELSLLTGQHTMRGGSLRLTPDQCIYTVKDMTHRRCYDMFMPDYIKELKEHFGNMELVCCSRGMILHDAFYIPHLRWKCIETLPAASATWPQLSLSLSDALEGSLSLGDLCHWFSPPQHELAREVETLLGHGHAHQMGTAIKILFAGVALLIGQPGSQQSHQQG